MFAVHFAEYCATHKNVKVLFVDIDGQGNSSSYFINRRAALGEGAFLLFGQEQPPEIVEVKQNLFLIPSDKKLNDVESLPMESIINFKTQIKEISTGFDIVIIDTPPSQGRRLVAALASSHAIVTPLGLDRSSFEGLTDLLNDINAIRTKLNHELKHIGILVNRYKPANKTQKSNLAKLKEMLGDRVLSTVLEDRSPVGVAYDSGHPVWIKSSGESARKAGKEFMDACKLVYERVLL